MGAITYANDIYNNQELYHYGVKGMKWGVKNKKELKVARKFARAARRTGNADYYREQGKLAYKEHDQNAKVFDKTANKYEKEGSYIKAQIARKTAEAIRARGNNIKAQNDARADSLMKRASKLNEKASKFATKKRVDLGKKTIDNIVKESRKKGYENQKFAVEAQKERELRDQLGEDNYNTLNKIRGLS